MQNYRMPFLQGADLPLSYYYSKYTTSTVGCQYLEGEKCFILFTLTSRCFFCKSGLGSFGQYLGKKNDRLGCPIGHCKSLIFRC